MLVGEGEAHEDEEDEEQVIQTKRQVRPGLMDWAPLAFIGSVCELAAAALQ